MLVLDATVVNVALPRIDADLGFGPASLSWVLNAYTLAFGGLLLLGGRLGDVRGRLRTFQAGLALFVLASLLGGLAPTTELLDRGPRPPGRRRRAGRAERPRPAHHQRPRRRRSATAPWPCSPRSPPAAPRSACCSAACSPTSPRGAGRCSSTCRSAWPCSLLAPMFVRETERRPGRFDVVGAVTATLGAVAIVWALIGTPEHGWTSARTIVGLALGVLSLATAGPQRAPRRAPDDPAAPPAQPHPGRRARGDGPGVGAQPVDVLPGGAVRAARARLRAARRGRRVPGVQPRRSSRCRGSRRA